MEQDNGHESESKAFIEEMAERLDEDLFTIGSLFSYILMGPGPIVDPKERSANARCADVLDELRSALPDSKRDLIGKISDAYSEYIRVTEQQSFAVGVLLGAMLAGKSRDEAVRLARLWKPRDYAEPEGKLNGAAAEIPT
jgi:hypothetical protein